MLSCGVLVQCQSKSILGGQGEGVHSFQQVQGQAVLGVIFWQNFNQTADQSGGLWQRDQGASELAGILQHTRLNGCLQTHYIFRKPFKY